MKVSVITPIYNESESLPELFAELTSVLKGSNHEYEIICVDDASKDKSFDIIKKHAQDDQHIKGVRFLVNQGQTAAIQAGIDTAVGDVLVLIDSDLENDPTDILVLLNKLNSGFDVVSGWRKDRWSGPVAFLKRKIPSVLANWCIRKVTHVPLNDFGCTLKAYRSEVIKPVLLFGEMHRFIPFYAKLQGARITEVPVNYRNRKYGNSNYGLSRTFRVLLDLILIKFIDKYFNKPMHFFGKIGFHAILLAFLCMLWATILKYFYTTSFIQTPLPIAAAMFIISAILLFSIGILAEMIMRVFYLSKNERSYKIKEKVNLI
jgi:glycosyltransferase involved in cell wall biosynthesis